MATVTSPAETDDAPIPLARPAISDVDVHAAERALRSGRLVLGPENQRFEARLAELSGRAHAVCVTSGTTALELALWGLVPPDQARSERVEILVPAGGFPAAANAVLRLGGVPIAVDIDPDTWTMDIEAAGAAITDATRALVSVDTLGVVAEAGPLRELARDAGIALIDDAACSLGATDSAGTPGGGYGAAGTFSFHPRKLITTGEGGAVVCDDDARASALRELRNQGQAGRGQFTRVGTNARLGEIAAAIGCAQLDRLDAMLRERAILVAGYRERLADAREAGALSLQAAPEGAEPAHQTFAVQLGPDIDRAQVQAHMTARGIETGVALFSLNRLDSFASLPSVSSRKFPVAEALHDRGLALPLYAGMRSADLDRVCGALVEVLS